MRRFASILLLLVTLIACSSTLAENSTRFDGYTLHHNALPSVSIDPRVAAQYQITRSRYRGLLNVSVIQESPDTTGKAVNAQLEVSYRNPIGRIESIEMREIRERDAIYYIGQFPIVDGETLTFSIEARIPGLKTPLKTQLSQDFYID